MKNRDEISRDLKIEILDGNNGEETTKDRIAKYAL